MSLEPKWSSTIFGVYQFAGIFLSSLAAVTVVTVALCWRDPLRGVVTTGQFHDLGTLLFSFSSFWMYIWFSQYLLIWYVNNPEETAYFRVRQTSEGPALLLLNLALNWGFPFTVLLFRFTKQQPLVLGLVALAVLVGRWLDLYLMILPPVTGSAGPLSAWDGAAMIAPVAVTALLIARSLARAPLVPLAHEAGLARSEPRTQHSGVSGFAAD
jgi:hypothetical protein